MIEATKDQVANWIERQRAQLTADLASCDRALNLPSFRAASPQRTRLEQSRAIVLVDLGIIETLWACHQRWQLAREGMHAEIMTGVHYESGPMNEVADEMFDAHGVNGIINDVTPIFDRMRETYEAK